MTSVFSGKSSATNNSEVKLQIRATLKNGGKGSAFNEFTSTDSRYIFAKEEEISSDDAINVSADAEDVTECCILGNSTPKQHTSP